MDQPVRSPARRPGSPLTVCLGRMPTMLREILSQTLGLRRSLRVILDPSPEGDPVAVLRQYHPDALLLGRPDCDHLEVERLVRISPATRIVEFSPDGRTAVVYEPNALPVTLELPSVEDLVGLMTASDAAGRSSS